MAGALGLIKIRSATDVMRDRDEQRQAALVANEAPVLRGLARFVQDQWQTAKRAKNYVLPRLRRAQAARQGEYEYDKLRQIREFGGSEEYARITANKCRVVEAWLRDVFLGQTDKPWTLNATPDPDFPPEIRAEIVQGVAMAVAQAFAATGQIPSEQDIRAQQTALTEQAGEQLQEQARKAVERMERLIEDQLAQGGFSKALAEFLADFVTYPTAIFKGPVLRKQQKLVWGKDEEGRTKPEVVEETIPMFERVDPFKFYPMPGITSPQEGGVMEVITFEESDLYDLIGLDGFSEEAIRAVLEEGGYSNWLSLSDSDMAEVDDQPMHEVRKTLEVQCLEYHGPVRGEDLLEWGMDTDEVTDPDKTYDACVWLIGRWVIKAQLNYDPLGVRPYFTASYEELPGEFWGYAVPDILDDMQGVANAALRALVNNMAISSGPQVGVNVDRLAPGHELTNLTPWTIWQMQDNPLGGNDQRSPLEFFQPTSNARELLEIFESCYRYADDFSLVPRFMAGSDKVGGAGRTASGLSMLMDAANKGLKGVVSNIDHGILAPLLNKLYAHNMTYHDDETVKGDAQVVARGAVSLMQLESLQLRRNEFLNITANPLDSQITGLEGRAEVLREVARGLELDTAKVVPPREVMQNRVANAQAPQGQPAPDASKEQLQNGAAVTDNFSPSGMV